MNVIIIDDEKEITDSYGLYLKRNGVTNFTAYNDPRDLIKDIDTKEISVAFLDLQMPFFSGEELLETIKSKFPKASVVILTGSTDIESAVRCMQKGAADYLVKPIDKDRFAAAYSNAVNAYNMHTEIEALRSAMLTPKINNVINFHGIITSDTKMQELFSYVDAVAKSSFPVLITGETGVGKELFANAVHKAGGRKGMFIAVNVSGLDDNMFSDTLFGHVKGAFTGADKPRKGLLAEAEGGTIFLDEIGDLNENAQIKLLRILQEKVYMPLGSDKSVQADVRIVSATNAVLTDKVKEKTFRQDLLFRLSTHSVTVPPLRERQSDIPILATAFYESALKQMGRNNSHELPSALIHALRMFDFPGNIRQLQAVMADMAAVFSGKKIKENEAAVFLKRHGISIGTSCGEGQGFFSYSGCFPTLKELEQYHIEAALTSADGNISTAAKMLGISRQALHKRLKTSD